jgi:hypothetical protein
MAATNIGPGRQTNVKGMEAIMGLLVNLCLHQPGFIQTILILLVVALSLFSFPKIKAGLVNPCRKKTGAAQGSALKHPDNPRN